MKEEIYHSLCVACDRVLLAADSTMERVSIPWLHVVREHPVFLKNYKEIVESKSGVKVTLQRWLRLIRNKVWWLYQLGKSIRSDGMLWHGPQEFDLQTDVLLVSHLINDSHAGLADDFYFGNLPNDLVKQGYKVVIVLMNHTGQSGAELATKWIDSKVPRVVLSGSLSIVDEMTLHYQLKKEAARLRQFARQEPHGLARRVLMRATEEALSGGAHTTLRMSRQIDALVTKLQPKVIVVTHEGHAWERVAFAAARSAHSNVLCIGYQHAAVFRLQHAIRRCLAPRYNPDQILTAGEVSCAQLKSSPGLEGIPISVLGSNRIFKGGITKPEHQTHTDCVEHSAGQVCLVLPDGIPSECHLMFEFSILCAKVNPEIQFIWRLHPMVTFESLKAQNPKLRNHPGNIMLSEATLEEDIARSRWALYRGTTAIVQAVVAGLRPIYLQLPDELTIDPLYELDILRVSVKSVSEFHRAILPNLEISNVQLESDFEQARKYCESFFTPFNVGKLSALIQ